MGLAEIIIISLGLSADAFAVALGNGLCGAMKPPRNVFNALVFGLFQGVMPVLGYLLGQSFSEYVTAYDHVIALLLLGFIGINMLKETASEESETTPMPINCGTVIVQGFATSIDALGAGASLNFSGTEILKPALIIAATSFFMSHFGFWFGNCFKNFPSKYLEITGGIILCGLALRAII